MPTIAGTFDVSLKPAQVSELARSAAIGAMSIDKRFHGDLDATSAGQMLMVQATVPGSAGYVAIERVSGRLAGKSGSFVLQHNATMNRGDGKLHIEVVPDSGSDELQGLTGTMAIEITSGNHSYRFDYELP